MANAYSPVDAAPSLGSIDNGNRAGVAYNPYPIPLTMNQLDAINRVVENINDLLVEVEGGEIKKITGDLTLRTGNGNALGHISIDASGLYFVSAS